MQRTQRVTMGFVGVLVASLLLVLVAAAQVPVEGYFCKDGTCVQRFIAPSLESNLYNIYTSPGTVQPSPGKVPPGNPNTYRYTSYNPPFPSAFLVQPLPPPRRQTEDTGVWGSRAISRKDPSRRGVFLFADVQADTPAHDC